MNRLGQRLLAATLVLPLLARLRRATATVTMGTERLFVLLGAGRGGSRSINGQRQPLTDPPVWAGNLSHALLETLPEQRYECVGPGGQGTGESREAFEDDGAEQTLAQSLSVVEGFGESRAFRPNPEDGKQDELGKRPGGVAVRGEVGESCVSSAQV